MLNSFFGQQNISLGGGAQKRIHATTKHVLWTASVREKPVLAFSQRCCGDTHYEIDNRIISQARIGNHVMLLTALSSV